MMNSKGKPSSPGEELLTRSTMGFYDHIDELRTRLMRGLTVFFLGFVGLFFVSEPILAFLRRPLFSVLPPDQQKLYFTSLFENFLTHLKVSGYASLFLCSPYLFYQVWGFVAPGLYPRERRLVVPFVIAATGFFLAGAGFAYGVLFPIGFKYFVQFGGPADVPLLTIDAYYSTCLKLMFLFGVAFELPVLISLLGALGVVDADFLRRQRRNAILGITVVSALFAPPDAMSMILLGAPLVLLYELSIFVVQAFGARRLAAERSAAIDAAHPDLGSNRAGGLASNPPEGQDGAGAASSEGRSIKGSGQSAVHPWTGKSSDLDH